MLTSVTVDVADNGTLCPIVYSVSPDSGATWIPVTDWNQNRSQGRIDFTEKNIVASQLGWKAEKADGSACTPQVDSITLKAKPKVAGALLSRATPVMVGNVLYASSFALPAVPGNLVGHVKAIKLYEPATPSVALSPSVQLWDRSIPSGSVDHSAPAVLIPPGTPAWVYGADTSTAERAGFLAFQKANESRKTAVFVGARDGKLHALNGGNFRWGDNPATATIKENHGYFLNNDYGAGEELTTTGSFWPYTPPVGTGFLDATPTLADVQLGSAWKTILLMTAGDGGGTVFCLDVTNPVTPRLIWEKNDLPLARRHSLQGAAKAGRLRIDGATKWVAFLVSGAPPSSDPTRFPSIFVIDAGTGDLLQEIRLDVPVRGTDGSIVTEAPTGEGGLVTGQPAVVDSDGNGYLDRLYVATDNGLVYKVNLPDGPLANWSNIGEEIVINWDFIDEECPSNSNDRQVPDGRRWQPIYAAPVAVVDNALTAAGTVDNRVRIYFGTADSPYVVGDGHPPYHFFAYVDQGPKGSSSAGDVKLDWFYTLDPPPDGASIHERVFASAEVSAGKVYFGTATSDTEDACDGENKGRVYAFDLTSVCGATPTTIINSGDVVTAPMVQDKHLFIRTSTGMVVMGGGNYNNEVQRTGTRKTTPQAWREIE